MIQILIVKMGLNAETDLQWTQESLSRYQLGGYHPVTLGDEFKDRRYTVHHKLAFSTSFTEWLARDELSVFQDRETLAWL